MPTRPFSRCSIWTWFGQWQKATLLDRQGLLSFPCSSYSSSSTSGSKPIRLHWRSKNLRLHIEPPLSLNSCRRKAGGPFTHRPLVLPGGEPGHVSHAAYRRIEIPPGGTVQYAH